MAKTLFEQNGGTYRRREDYFLPNIKLPEHPEFKIGVGVIAVGSIQSNTIKLSITIC